MNNSNPKSAGNQAFEELKQHSEAALADLGDGFEQATTKLLEVTEDLSNTAVATIKKYPIHTALAAGAIGFLIGAMVSSKKK